MWEEKTKEIRAEMSQILEPLRKTKAEGGIKTFEDEVQEAILMDPSKRDPWQQMMYHTAEPRIAFDEEPDARTLRTLKGDAGTRYAELKKAAGGVRFAEAGGAAARPVHDRHQRHGAADLRAHARRSVCEGRRSAAGFPVDPRSERREDHAAAGLNSTGRRTALAAWLTDPKNPLVARVMVNRIWHYHFGTGIVATPGDFGRMGSRPTHPELLDYLASYFVENGWSMKKLHRLILLSNTYQQSSDNQAKAAEADPDNKLLWRYNRHRMEAEAIRDSMLFVSGLLNPQNGRSWRVPAGSRRALSANFRRRLPPAAGGPRRIRRRTIAAASTSSCGATCAIRCCRSSIPPTLSKLRTRARTR